MHRVERFGAWGFCGLGFRVQGWAVQVFRVLGLEGVRGLSFRVDGLGFRGSRVEGCWKDFTWFLVREPCFVGSVLGVPCSCRFPCSIHLCRRSLLCIPSLTQCGHFCTQARHSFAMSLGTTARQRRSWTSQMFAQGACTHQLPVVLVARYWRRERNCLT